MRVGTVVRLLLASLVVGLVLRWLELQPGDLIERARAALTAAFEFARQVLGQLVDSGGDLVGYTLLGAIIVVPVWLLSHLWKALRRRG